MKRHELVWPAAQVKMDSDSGGRRIEVSGRIPEPQSFTVHIHMVVTDPC